MSLTLVLGGARSGKSQLAARLMGPGSGPVAMIATAEGGDDEMRQRIIRHREGRPRHWMIVEEPVELERAVAGVEVHRRLIIDCLTLWVTNLMGLGLDDAEIEERARRAAVVAAGRESETVVVSNEVGSGIVPDNALGRRYRDLLGRVNTIWAEEADSVYLTVAGGIVPVERAESLWRDPTGG